MVTCVGIQYTDTQKETTARVVVIVFDFVDVMILMLTLQLSFAVYYKLSSKSNINANLFLNRILMYFRPDLVFLYGN